MLPSPEQQQQFLHQFIFYAEQQKSLLLIAKWCGRLYWTWRGTRLVYYYFRTVGFRWLLLPSSSCPHQRQQRKCSSYTIIRMYSGPSVSNCKLKKKYSLVLKRYGQTHTHTHTQEAEEERVYLIKPWRRGHLVDGYSLQIFRIIFVKDQIANISSKVVLRCQ